MYNGTFYLQQDKLLHKLVYFQVQNKFVIVQLLQETHIRHYADASQCASCHHISPGALPKPRLTLFGKSVSIVPNCSATIRGAWFGNIIPPDPTLIRFVCSSVC